MKKSFKDILIRAVKTFVQGFIASLSLSLPTMDFNDETYIRSALIGAIAGGVSAVMNLISNLFKTSNDEEC